MAISAWSTEPQSMSVCVFFRRWRVLSWGRHSLSRPASGRSSAKSRTPRQLPTFPEDFHVRRCVRGPTRRKHRLSGFHGESQGPKTKLFLPTLSLLHIPTPPHPHPPHPRCSLLDVLDFGLVWPLLVSIEFAIASGGGNTHGFGRGVSRRNHASRPTRWRSLGWN